MYYKEESHAKLKIWIGEARFYFQLIYQNLIIN